MYLIKKDKKVRIAISGQSGCGNTTVSTLISQKLNINHFFLLLPPHADLHAAIIA